VRIDCGVSRDGSKAKNVALAAMRYGFNVKAYRFDPQTIQKEASFPCIIHWNMNHFVVLDGFKGNRAYLNDPARGAAADAEISLRRLYLRARYAGPDSLNDADVTAAESLLRELSSEEASHSN
jgi:ABC-type bacteriocin/lantibiotic exporter with double-glycine peptidase domain